MISKINFLDIIRSHFATLRDDGKQQASISDVILFYGVPMITSGGVVFVLEKTLSKGAIDFLATVFSIFIGLLLNLLVMIFDVTRNSGNDPAQAGKKILLQETFSNICYAILISVILIGLLFISKLINGTAHKVCSFVVFFIVVNFLLTLLMVLKRVHRLLWQEAR